MSYLRRRFADLVLAFVGIVIALPSLAYPFSWDTSVHYYVAREWLLRGAVPYRDAFDHKTPGIYLVHAACLALFGESMVGIRVVEILEAVAIGVAAAWCVAPRKREPAPGARGASVLAVCIFHFGCLDHWNTAQCELTCAALAVLALLAVRRSSTLRRAALIGGALAGAALLVKPTVLALIVVVGCTLLVRAGGARRALGASGIFAAAAAAPWLAFVAYFAAVGALGPARESIFAANATYVTSEARAHDLPTVLRASGEAFRLFAPLSSAIVVMLALAIASARMRRDRDALGAYVAGAALLAAGALSAIVQLKFYRYHWTLAVVGVAMTPPAVLEELRRLFAARRAWTPWPLAATLAFTFVATGHPFLPWFDDAVLTAKWAMGKVDRDRFEQRYDCVEGRRPWSVVERVGLWLRDHSSPDDLVLVRGESTEIYVVSGRHAPGRFFWSVFLSSPTRVVLRDAWVDEDKRELLAHPPRFVVVRDYERSGLASEAWFTPLGYERRETIGSFVILERAGAALAHHAPPEGASVRTAL